MKANTRKLAFAAVVGALYAVLTISLGEISYGPIQFRISEALCVLPFFAPWSVLGLTIGCVIANLLSPAGILDMIFGPIATLLAALCTMYIGRAYRCGGALRWTSSILACLMPVVFNGIIVGAILAYTYPLTEGFLFSWLIFGAEVAGGELTVLFLLGLPLIRLLHRTPILKRFLKEGYPQNEG